MPCALTSNTDYPGYIKAILKEIDAGNDETLKACACSLKTPVTDEGCPILDEDGKVGAFPFCWTQSDISGVGANTRWPVGVSLKQAMNLYWNTLGFSIKTNPPPRCAGIGPGCADILNIGAKGIDRGLPEGFAKKELVCFHPLLLLSSSTSSSVCSYSFHVEDPWPFGWIYYPYDVQKIVKQGDNYTFYPCAGDFSFNWSYGCQDFWSMNIENEGSLKFT